MKATTLRTFVQANALTLPFAAVAGIIGYLIGSLASEPGWLRWAFVSLGAAVAYGMATPRVMNLLIEWSADDPLITRLRSEGASEEVVKLAKVMKKRRRVIYIYVDDSVRVLIGLAILSAMILGLIKLARWALG